MDVDMIANFQNWWYLNSIERADLFGRFHVFVKGDRGLNDAAGKLESIRIVTKSIGKQATSAQSSITTDSQIESAHTG